MKITNLYLETENLNNSLSFYQNTLGLTVVEQTAKEVRFQAGETLLTFTENKNKTPFYHFAFNIATNHLEQAIAWAQANHIELLPSPKNEIITHFDTWKAKSIYFWDLNGNLLEFIARADIQTTKAQPFSPKEMLNISEIGIVTAHPMQTAEAIMQQTGLQYFSKSAPLPEFCAIGDDEGLLIFVSPERNWYPTQLKAQPSTATIKLEVSNSTHTILASDWK
ncbi:VOC family protein [Myroides fluvii]|uniref:VOC family protein n=1 Tax=Myroides fluvii TaxID=2572594 RepID=UPI00131D031C|nr:VOC family protein [Myroides fluvii]